MKMKQGQMRNLCRITLALLTQLLFSLDVCRCSTVSVPPEPVTTTVGAEFRIKCGIASTTEPEGVRVKRIVKEDGITEEAIYQSLPENWEEDHWNTTKFSLIDFHAENLIVEIMLNNVSFQDAGTYICEPMVLAEERETTAVVVLGQPVVILPTITAGESFQATCEVEFRAPPKIAEGNRHFPELIGKVDNTEYNGTTNYTGGELGANTKLEMNMNITLAESNNGCYFWCVARTSTPSHAVASSKTLDIKYEVTQPELPKRDHFFVGEVIQCQAEGNPIPTITWKPIKSKIKRTFQENLTTVGMMVGEPDEVWTCEACNEIQGEPVVKTRNITFSVGNKGDGKPKEAKGASNNTVAIALGVTIPLIIIGIAVALVIVLFFRNRRGKGKVTTSDDTDKMNMSSQLSVGSSNMGTPGPLAADPTSEDSYDPNYEATPAVYGRNTDSLDVVYLPVPRAREPYQQGQDKQGLSKVK